MSGTHPLAEQYRSAVEAGDLAALAGLYQPDVLFDAHVPNWRFQLQGRDAVAEHTGGALPSPGHFTSFDVTPTTAGDLLVQFEWHGPTDDGGAVVRQLHMLHLDEGRIAAQVMFCAGVWSPQLQQQMASAAPLIRP